MTAPKLDDQTLLEGASLGTSADEDLDSIMQELESMEAEVAGAEGAVGDTEVEKSDLTETNSAPTKAEVADTQPRPTKRSRSAVAAGGASATQALTLELTGSLNLKLSFATGSRTVELLCSDDALICRFGDGTEVRIPTAEPARATALKRIA